MTDAISRRLKSLESLLASKRLKSAMERLCIERQMRDLETGHQRGLVWREDEAVRVVEFAKLLRHWKGEWAGKPFVPQDWQNELTFAPLFGWYLEDGRRRFTTGYKEVPRKNGKMLALETPIPTPTGWTTIGEVREGDILFDEAGQQCRVTAVHPIDMRPDSYLITFSNGETIRACADHLWVTTARVNAVGIGAGAKGVQRCEKGANCQTRVRTTREIYETQAHGRRGDRNHSLKMPAPLHLEQKPLPVDPYVLGAWLGDGTSCKAVITCSSDDWQIIDEIASRGIPVRRRDNATRSPTAILSNGKPGDTASLTSDLRRLGVLNNKHIPREYLRASLEQRLELLQGLMDTDGTVSKSGRILEFVTKSQRLAEDIAELLATMGLKYSMRSKLPRCNGRVLETRVFMVQFVAFRDELPVFKLRRKLERMRRLSDCSRGARSRTVQIVSVEPCPPVPMRCLSVDSPTRQFLVGRTMLPTHNTSESAVIALQGLIADGEAGAEVYSAATMRDQAAILFADAQNMVRQSPQLLAHLKLWKHSITCDSLAGSFKPLSADHNSLHGLNISRCIVDEIHSHKTRDLWDVLITATGARRKPLVFGITTAGYDRSTICWELHEYSRKILEGNHQDDSFFCFVSCADPEDDPFDPAVWEKANPNLDVSIKREYLAQEANKAKESPSYENTFRRLHLNQWTEQAVRWLPMHVWDECKGAYSFETLWDQLKGRECFAGLDLASTRDVNSLGLVFPLEDEHYAVLLVCWVPTDAKDDRGERDRRQVMNWADQNLIRKTPGNVIDHQRIRRDVNDLRKQFEIREIAYDPWNSLQLALELQDDGFEMVEFRQTIANFAGPTKRLEELVIGRRLAHGANPVLRWMASNVTVKVDPSGNMRPDKANSADKIDGIVATIMGLARAMLNEGGAWNFQPGTLAV